MLPSASPQDLERLPFAVAIVASVTACLTAFDAFRASVLAFFTLLVPEPCSIRLAAWVMRRWRAWDTVSAVQSVGCRALLRRQSTPAKPRSGQGIVVLVVEAASVVVVVVVLLVVVGAG